MTNEGAVRYIKYLRINWLENFNQLEENGMMSGVFCYLIKRRRWPRKWLNEWHGKTMLEGWKSEIQKCMKWQIGWSRLILDCWRVWYDVVNLEWAQCTGNCNDCNMWHGVSLPLQTERNQFFIICSSLIRNWQWYLSG